MKKSFLLLLLSFVLSVGSFSVSAKDNHKGNNGHKGNNRVEHFEGRGNNKPVKNFAKDVRKYEKDRYKAQKRYEKDREKYYKQQRKFYRHYHQDRVRDFWGMVNYAIGGGRYDNVWQISDDVYMVRYWKNGRMYVRTINPYTSYYGAPSIISSSWSPNPLWMLLPHVNVNINL